VAPRATRDGQDADARTVTATTLQFSFNMVDGGLQQAVNCFWFLSLVFRYALSASTGQTTPTPRAASPPPSTRSSG
jgi:hypothetical protein